MPGLMARILSRRADGAPDTAPAPADAPPADQPTVVVPAHGDGAIAPSAQPVDAPVEGAAAEDVAEDAPVAEDATATKAATATEAAVADAPAAEDAAPDSTTAAADSPTIVAPAVPAPEDPAPAAEEALAAEPDAVPRASLRNRSALRRRLRYLRRVREIGFRDLGGLVFDLDRFGRERPDLVELKLTGLKAIDAELRSLETALDDVREVEELHEPGITACVHCGALHGSDARFCPACGTAVGAPPAETPETAPADPE